MARDRYIATPGRLDAVVATLTGEPRAEIQRALVDGRVTVDGERRPKSFRLDRRRAARGGPARAGRAHGGGAARAGAVPGRRSGRGGETGGSRHPPGGASADRNVGQPAARHGGPLGAGWGTAAARDRPSPRRRDERPHGRRRNGPRLSMPCRRCSGATRSTGATWPWCAAHPTTRLRRRGPAGPPFRPYRGRPLARPPRRDLVRRPRTTRGRHAPGGRAGHGAHPSDQGASRGGRSPDRG